jgi:predicted TIM-barrel fold metal-dependent hydrolase
VTAATDHHQGQPFVDTHVHFWDHAVEDVTWEWLVPGVNDGMEYPIVGVIDSIKAPRYTSEEFLGELDNLPVRKVVHVQAAVGTVDPVAETRWLDSLSDSTGFPTAIIAHSDLRASQLEEELDRHFEASARMRGIRDFSQGNYLEDSRFERGYAILGRRGLVAELDCRVEDMDKAYELARKNSEVITVLDHAGYPAERTSDYFDRWRVGIAALAKAENVHCKISGLGMGDHNWTVESLRPWITHCIESFGPSRCVFGTNWPVDRLFSSYEELLQAYAAITSGFSVHERAAMFVQNAEKLFGI